MIKISKRKCGGLLIAVGTLLVFAALLLCLSELYADMNAGQISEEILEQISIEAAEEDIAFMQEAEYTPAYIENPNMEMPVQKTGGEYYIGTLSVPKLKLTLPVMDEWSYKRLKKSPCRYAGSAYKSGFVICGHNYRSHFGGLSRLEIGDTVTFTDIDGNEFNYAVSAIEVLPPEAVEEMKDTAWDLSLFTCTPGGGSRRTVRCDRIEQGKGKDT